jgi:hypothetical protein
MATNVDKALYRAPRGLSSFDPNEDPIEVVVQPDNDDEENGGLDDADQAVADATNEAFDKARDTQFAENLAEDIIPEDRLQSLASELTEAFDDDLNSRKDWVQTYVDGLELLGLKIEDRTEPWEGACGVYHPILSEALVKFQAETMMETFPAAGPVKTEVIGKETPPKMQAAARVAEDMNYQLTEKMVEYRPEHERLLWGLGLAGNAFKKIYYDPNLRRQTAMFVPAEDLVVPYGATSIQTSERVTHVMRKTPNEVKKLQASGFYLSCDLAEPMNTLDEVEKKIAQQLGFNATTDGRYKLLEMHVDLIIPEDPEVDPQEQIARPYVVTLEKGEQKILAVRRNWRPDDDDMQKRNHFVHYSYVPGFGFYAFGLIHLIGAFAKSGTSLIRQLVDAGTLSNLPGGFKTKGMRVKGDDTPIGPGEWRDVDVASGTMRENIMPLPYKEPSQVLASLLQTIIDEGRRFASVADLKISDMSAESPVGTTLAILERTMKVMSAIQARIYYAMRQEFKLIRDIIRDFTPDEYTYEPDTGDQHAKKGDYDLVEVIPVGDPNAATMAQKVVQYQAVLQLSQTAPQIYDLPHLHRQMIEILGVKNAEKLVPVDDDLTPKDPVTENMAILTGKPVKAFLYQDHDSHLQVHQAASQDPSIQQSMGQNPKAPMIMGAMQAHIAEHIAFQYRKQIEDQAGVPYPDPEANMTPDVELAVSRLAAAAAQQVLQANQAKAQQSQAQQQAQDPMVQMAQQELQIKQQDHALKDKKTQADIAAKADELDIERERIASQERIAGLQVGAKIASSKAQLDASQEATGLKVGVQVAESFADRAHAKEAAGGSSDPQSRMQTQAAATRMLVGASDAAADANQPAAPPSLAPDMSGADTDASVAPDGQGGASASPDMSGGGDGS